MNKVNSLPDNLKGVKFTKVNLNVHNMTAAISTQRKLDVKRVQEIYRNWNSGLANPIKINAIDGGGLRIIDGQHTWAAYMLRLKNGLETSPMFPCICAYNLTFEQENSWLLYEDGKNKDQPNSVKIKASIAAKDPVLERLINTLGIFGFTIKHSGKPGIQLNCVDTLLSISDNALFRTMMIIMDAYGSTNADALKAPFIKGIANFCEIYKTDVDLTHLSKKLSTERPAQLMAHAKSMTYLPSNQRLPSLLVPIYNKGLRKNKRLDEAKIHE